MPDTRMGVAVAHRGRSGRRWDARASIASSAIHGRADKELKRTSMLRKSVNAAPRPLQLQTLAVRSPHVRFAAYKTRSSPSSNISSPVFSATAGQRGQSAQRMHMYYSRHRRVHCFVALVLPPQLMILSRGPISWIVVVRRRACLPGQMPAAATAKEQHGDGDCCRRAREAAPP